MVSEVRENVPMACEAAPALCKGVSVSELVYNAEFMNALKSIHVNLLNMDKFKMWIMHTFKGMAATSLQNIEHLRQLFASTDGAFRKFDYGLIGNNNHYGMMQAPKIDIKQIQVPIGMFVGSIDELGVLKDNLNIKAQLEEAQNGGVLKAFEVIDGHDHLSLVMGKDMKYF